MKPRSFKLAKLSLWGLLISTGVLVVAGTLSLLGTVVEEAAPTLKFVCVIGFTGIAGFALPVSQAAASCAQVLSGDGRYESERGWALFCAGVTALASVAGVYLGDSVLRGDHPEMPPLAAMLVGALLLSFIKPTMSYVITACETKSGADAKADDVVLAAKDKRISDLEREVLDLRARIGREPGQADAPTRDNALPANDISRTHDRPRRVSDRDSRRVADALKRERPNNPRFDHAPGLERVVKRAPPLSAEAIERAIADLTAQAIADGRPPAEVISIRSVARYHDAPTSRVTSSPGKGLIAAAKAA